MLATIIATIREIIKFRKLGREDRKIGLEIRKLEEEQQQRERLIQPASFADVERYDPKLGEIRERIARQVKEGKIHEGGSMIGKIDFIFIGIGLVLILVLIVFLIWKFIQWLSVAMP